MTIAQIGSMMCRISGDIGTLTDARPSSHGRVSDHLTRVLDDIDRAATACSPTEDGVVGLARFVEAVFKAMDGGIPACVRSLVRSFAFELETIGFMTDTPAMDEAVQGAIGSYRQALNDCLASNQGATPGDVGAV
jgi:hypothetical protein